MSAAFSIGPLAAEEAEAAVALWERAGLTRPWNDPRADLALALRTPAAAVLAGRTGGMLAATAMVGFDGHRGWVYYLAVDERWRGSGFGAAMMEAAERWLADRGAPKVQLMVREDNAAAAGFYRRLGYERGRVAVLQKRLEPAG